MGFGWPSPALRTASMNLAEVPKHGEALLFGIVEQTLPSG
jgi:hypothetical protein